MINDKIYVHTVDKKIQVMHTLVITFLSQVVLEPN